MTLSCTSINDSTQICATLESTGTGLGVFVQAIGQALPYFLIILGVVGIVIAIGMAIAGVIRNAMHHVKTR